jgi:protein-S-isoprenylcysteine O-methyltransferase Ste14
VDTYLILYIVFVGLYRVSELLVMSKTGTIARKPVRDWTAWLIMVPYWLVIVTPPVAYLARTYRRPGLAALIAGGLLFLAAAVVRVKAHLDLGGEFSMFLEEHDEQQTLVTTGLYKTLRHPLYLANLLLFLACPTFLAVGWAWIITAVGIVGILVRIRMEERFLMHHFEGYADYREKTWKLIPHIY